MDMQFDITSLIKLGKITSELDFERSLIADRKLRLLAKEDEIYKKQRKKLRDLIEAYENKNWSSTSIISNKQLKESDFAEIIAEKERKFIDKRKELIKDKLKILNLNQQDFGLILGHKSKSYISELMNGIISFSLKDLVVINQLFNIDLIYLVPTFLPQTELTKISTSIKKLENPKLKLVSDNFAFV